MNILRAGASGVVVGLAFVGFGLCGGCSSNSGAPRTDGGDAAADGGTDAGHEGTADLVAPGDTSPGDGPADAQQGDAPADASQGDAAPGDAASTDAASDARDAGIN